MIIEIAGLRVKLNNKYPFTERFCEKYAVDGEDYDVEATATDEEITAEKAHSPNFSEGYSENICLYRSICHKLPLYKRFLLHSSVVVYDGDAYAFLGRSGAGKSTHSALWLKYIKGSEILNGDKPIIGENGGEFTAYGTPWNGKEKRGKKGEATLKGLCFIEQAERNEIVRLSEGEAAMRVFKQILLPQDETAVTKTLEMVDSLVRNVPSYTLYCDISEDAVKLSFSALSGKRYEEARV